MQPAFELFDALVEPLFLVLNDEQLLAGLVAILCHLGRHLRGLVCLALYFSLELLVLLIQSLNHAVVLLDLGLVLVLKPFHLFL